MSFRLPLSGSERSWVFAADSVLKTMRPGILPNSQEYCGGFQAPVGSTVSLRLEVQERGLGNFCLFAPAALVLLGVLSFQVLLLPVPEQPRCSRDIYSAGTGLGS